MMKKSQLIKLNKEDAKTIAWSIAFEGSISIIKSQRKKYFNLCPTIGLYNTDHSLIKSFKKMVGYGRIFKRNRREKQHSNSYVWRITSFSQVLPFIELILPYSPTDKFKEKCNVIKEFCLYRKKEAGHPYTDYEISLYNKIKELNKKGNHG